MALTPAAPKSLTDAGLGAAAEHAADRPKTPADYIPGSFSQVHRLTRRYVAILVCPGGVLEIHDTGKTSRGRYEFSGTQLEVRFGRKTETYEFKSDPQYLGVRDQLLRYAGPPDCSTLGNKADAGVRKGDDEAIPPRPGLQTGRR